MPLNIACVFSPPSEGRRDIAQLQEDLPQELADNRVEPNRKKAALKEIIDDYNTHFGTHHDLANFDSYYQDIQRRIKDQKYPNKRSAPGEEDRHHHRVWTCCSPALIRSISTPSTSTRT